MNTGFELYGFGGGGKMFGWSALDPAEVSAISDRGRTVEDLTKPAVAEAARLCSRVCVSGACGLEAKIFTSGRQGSASVEIACEEEACSANQSIPTISRAHSLFIEAATTHGITERVIDDISTAMGGAVIDRYIEQN